MSRHLTVAALLAMMLAAVTGGLLSGEPASAAAADPAPPGSAVTVSGKGDFANLKVTVSQTKNLINQTVKVSWTGGTPTVNNNSFFIHYLQIMQCWGDDPAGPDRTQCQFGVTNTQRGDNVGSRQVNATLVDPNETLKQPEGSFLPAYVPFWPAGREKPIGPTADPRNDFFDSQITNEIPLARTHGDGSGEEFFELETADQAAGLGCGEPVIAGGSTTGRPCWLVIVPRGNKEVDGKPRTGTGGVGTVLESSPLSQSNWDNRIVIPLEFQLVGQACPIGSPERPVVGHEMVVDAVTSWQPALCAGGGTLFSYTQLPDEVARRQVRDGRLALVTSPIPVEEPSLGRPLVYAPVGLSGLVIAFNINYQPDPQHRSPADLENNGRRFTSMKLTPRLVAKLLTQSYLNSVRVPPDETKQNPIGLLFDQEFTDLNPEYKGFVDRTAPVPDALVQLNGVDVTAQLWSWVKADPDASAFLAGTPDQFGMRVNHHNQNLSLPTSTFPRNDQGCTDEFTEEKVKLTTCNLDLHPFTKDMHDAGRSASRGDTQAKIPVVDNGNAVPKSVPRQVAGKQGLLAVADAVTAARYGLPTAQLRNSAGNYVAPTPESLLAGAAAMKPSSVPGVLVADPGAGDRAAYPLTAVSYAVASPSTLDAAAGEDYAAFLRYAGGPGQQQGLAPGLLPAGMVPLPEPLKAQTIAAAVALEAQTVPDPPATTPTTTVPAQNPAGIPSTPATRTTPTNSIGAQPAARPPGVITPSAGPPVKAPGKVQQPVAGVRRTPSLPAPALGALLLVVLISTALAATSSPLLQLLSGGLRHRRREEVVLTEQ